MFAMIHGFSILAAIVSLALSVRLFFAKKRKLACRWGAAAILSLICFALYYIPFHIRLDADRVVLMAFDAGPHLVVDSQDKPEKFHHLDLQLQALAFKRPFLYDARIYDAFRKDTVTVTNNDKTIYVIFPSNTTGGYAVLNQEAVAPVTDEFIQYIALFNK